MRPNVADIKNNFLGTPFLEEYTHNINIQDFTLLFKHHSRYFPNSTKFISRLSKDYPNFSYIYRINSKTQIHLKLTSSKIAKFPITKHYNLQFSTIPKKFFFLQYLTPLFLRNSVKHFNLSKLSQMTNQTHAPLLLKTLQITFPLYLQETLITLKFLSQTKNLNIIKFMT